MTRILFLIDELDVGGTEQQLLELVKRLDRRRYEPVVCCFRPGKVSKEIEASGIRVITLEKRGKVDPVFVAKLARMMRRERIDLLQTYLFTANTWGRLAARLARVPIIVTSERNVDMWEEWYKQRLGVWLDRWTQRTIGNSQAVGDYLAAKGIARAKLRVIYNGVDTSRFEGPLTPHAAREEFGIPQHHAVVGHPPGSSRRRIRGRSSPRRPSSRGRCRACPSSWSAGEAFRPSWSARRWRWDSAAASCSPGRGATCRASSPRATCPSSPR
jgi:glycosyltransferase involved in cell wall biosynthesis